MAARNIFTYGDSVLREKARSIETITPEITTLAEEMLETMQAASGIGLAAPQIGVSLRMIIVTYGMEQNNPVHKVIINPEILGHSNSAVLMEEGCLSVPDETAEVSRWTEITIRGMTREGQIFEEYLIGLTARIFQHELDHLDGILFVDRVSFLKRDLIRRRLKKRLKSNLPAA